MKRVLSRKFSGSLRRQSSPLPSWRRLTVFWDLKMKSTGEVMGSDRTLEKALYILLRLPFHLQAKTLWKYRLYYCIDSKGKKPCSWLSVLPILAGGIWATMEQPLILKIIGPGTSVCRKIGSDDNKGHSSLYPKAQDSAIINTSETKGQQIHGQIIRSSLMSTIFRPA